MRERVGQIYPMPAPTSGWNKKLPLPAIPETFALDMMNFFPTSTGIRKRNGYERVSADKFTSSCETVMSLNKEDGTCILISAGDHKLYSNNVTTFARTDITGTVSTTSAITSNKWQWIQFYDKIFLANGTDRVRSWDGSANTTAVANFTIGGAEDSGLHSPHTYNERLYFLKGTSIWYGNTRAINGVLTEYDLASILTRGGVLLFAGSSTGDIGSGMQEMFVAVTSQGEVLAFTGAIGESTWSLVGHFYLPRAMGRTSFVQMGSDIQLITNQGVIPMSEVLNPTPQDQKTGRYMRASESIDKAFSEAASNGKTLHGWCGVHYDNSDMLIINVPISSTISHQYVMNTLTEGAWTYFSGMNAASWCLLDGDAYFGGTDGHVYRFDKVQNDGVYTNVDGSGVRVNLETAFSYCGDPKMIKGFKLIKPLIYSTVAEANLSITINTNFQRGAQISPDSITGVSAGSWDVGEWDVDAWDDAMNATFGWRDVEGAGVNCSLLISGILKDMDLEILMFFIQFEPGGSL